MSLRIPFEGVKDCYLEFNENTFFKVLKEMEISEVKIKRLFDISDRYFKAKMFDVFLLGETKFLEIIQAG